MGILFNKAYLLDYLCPEQPVFDNVVTQVNSLFIFIKTLVLALKQCKDPKETLKAALQDSTIAGLKPLYNLYSSILKSQIVPSNAELRQVIGVLLTAAPYCTLSDKSIAELAGVKPNLVKMWVNDLSSLLYQDEVADGGIRV